MARFLSPIFSGISGSIAGTTFQRGRGGGLIARGRPNPANPMTPAQVAQRAVMNQLSAAWSGITPAARQLWADYGAEVPSRDSLGQEIVLTGQQAFNRANGFVARIGQALTLVAPVGSDPYLGPTGITATDAAVTVSFPDVNGDGFSFLQASAILSPGVNSPHQNLTLVASGALGTGDTEIVHTLANPIGARICFRAVNVSDDGRVSDAYQVIVTTTPAA